MPNDKCMKCGKPFVYKFTKIIKGQVHDILLCEEHAQQYSPYLQNKKVDQSKLVELLQHFLKQQEKMVGGGPGAVEKGDGPECSNCGLNYGAYRKTLLLGCSDCYDSFGRLLMNDLRKIHGAVSHGGEPADAPASPPAAEETSLFSAFQDELAMSVPPETSDSPDLEVQEHGLGEKDGLSREKAILKMEKELHEAIEREDFKLAANLRDSIRKRREKDQ